MRQTALTVVIHINRFLFGRYSGVVEHRHGDDEKSGSGPHVLHQKLLQHHVPQFNSEDALQMRLQRLVGGLQVTMFGIVSAVECNFFGVSADTSVSFPQLAAPCRFLGN